MGSGSGNQSVVVQHLATEYKSGLSSAFGAAADSSASLHWRLAQRL